MKTYAQIKSVLSTQLRLNASSSYSNARQPLDMDQQQQGDSTQQKQLASTSADHRSDDAVSVADPMLLSPEIMFYLQNHNFSVESIESLLTKELIIHAKHQEGTTPLLCSRFDHFGKREQCILNDDDDRHDKKARIIKDPTESIEQFPAT
ncbi:hypothetical protein [Cardinium endosymbiont of Sogatella furcifera]|uniref:hypothetical protein n=1 Tax=Cardinium endosymbiont of Sogatella furcifera TaxID=650378 RepID=UPI0013B3AD56|nr:hypothetical protein [Cardinium endosymbiont of Sogatella furcifera]